MGGIISSGILKKGRLSKSVAGGVNVTLSTDEAQNGIIELTGALTASIALIVPATDGLEWLIVNNSTSTGGPWSVTVRTAGGTGIVVTQGRAGVLYCNGTNVLAGVTPEGVGAQRSGRSELTFAADANKALTAAEYENGFLDFINSGTTLTAQRDIILPLQAGRAWLVRNNTPGGQAIQVIGATGTGVVLATGATRLFTNDGTNFIAVAPVA